MSTGRTIHYTELPPPQPGSALKAECNTYRREVGRLLAERQEGKYVLIKGETTIGVYETDQEALSEGYRRYLHEGFLVQQIRTWERVIRTRHGR